VERSVTPFHCLYAVFLLPVFLFAIVILNFSLGSESFVESLEKMLGRTLKLRKPGRKPKNK